MNNVKDELKEVLEERKRFTNANLDAVLQRIENKASRKNRFKMPAIAVSFIALLAFAILLFTNSQTPTVQTATEASLLTFLEERMDGQPYSLLYSKVGIREEYDAIIAYQTGEDDDIIFTEYLAFENKGWMHRQSTGVFLQGEAFWSSSVEEPYLFAGTLLNKNVKSVIVGQEETILIDIGNGRSFWFSLTDSRANRVVIAYEDGQYKRVEAMGYSENSLDIDVPIVSASGSDTKYRYLYRADNMDRGNHEYNWLHLIMDSTIGTLKRGDVILYKNEDGEDVISRVLSLPWETFAIQNGTVVMNGFPIETYYGYAKIQGETVYETYIELMGNRLEDVAGTEDIFFMDMEPIEVGANEVVVVPDNWARGKIEKVSLDKVNAMVLGYDQNEFINEWSVAERTLYEEFKQTNDPELFRDIEPVTIARVYFYANFLLDAQTAYRMYTTHEDLVLWTEGEHMRERTIIKQEKSRMQALEDARIMAISKFKQTDQKSGTLYYGEGEDMVIFNLVLSETGIWQVSFMPMQ